MGHHFGVKGFYVFSKAMEDMTLENNTLIGNVEDFHNIALDRGRSDFDRRHSSVTSVIWDMSYFDKTNPFLKAVINGWQLSGIVTLQSGLPFSVVTGADSNLDGNANDRANVTGNPFLDPHRSRAAVTAEWFNTSAPSACPPPDRRQCGSQPDDRTGNEEYRPRAVPQFPDPGKVRASRLAANLRTGSTW